MFGVREREVRVLLMYHSGRCYESSHQQRRHEHENKPSCNKAFTDNAKFIGYTTESMDD